MAIDMIIYQRAMLYYTRRVSQEFFSDYYYKLPIATTAHVNAVTTVVGLWFSIQNDWSCKENRFDLTRKKLMNTCIKNLHIVWCVIKFAFSWKKKKIIRPSTQHNVYFFFVYNIVLKILLSKHIHLLSFKLSELIYYIFKHKIILLRWNYVLQITEINKRLPLAIIN